MSTRAPAAAHAFVLPGSPRPSPGDCAPRRLARAPPPPPAPRPGRPPAPGRFALICRRRRASRSSGGGRGRDLRLVHLGAQAQVLDGAVARRRRACGGPRARSAPARCRACRGPRSRTPTCRPSRARRRPPASGRRCARPPPGSGGPAAAAPAAGPRRSARHEKAGPATATSSTPGSSAASARAALTVSPCGSLPPKVSSTMLRPLAHLLLPPAEVLAQDRVLGARSRSPPASRAPRSSPRR